MKVISPYLYGRCLDYGCGRGFDAMFLGMESYDPYWKPDKPIGMFDVITCNYVLNVVGINEQRDIIDNIISLLNRGGTSYFTVRRDIKKDYVVRDYVQRVVTLPFEVFHESRNKFIIYKLKLED